MKFTLNMNKEYEYLTIIKDLFDILDAYEECEGYVPHIVITQSDRIDKWREKNNIEKLLITIK